VNTFLCEALLHWHTTYIKKFIKRSRRIEIQVMAEAGNVVHQTWVNAKAPPSGATTNHGSRRLPSPRGSEQLRGSSRRPPHELWSFRITCAPRVEQFSLHVGDVVNPVMRSAGILISNDAERAGTMARRDN
jgi:hypothetical protein